MRLGTLSATCLAFTLLAGPAASQGQHDHLDLGTRPLGGGTDALFGVPHPDNVSVRAKWINPELATPPAARPRTRLVDPGITIVLPRAEPPRTAQAE